MGLRGFTDRVVFVVVECPKLQTPAMQDLQSGQQRFCALEIEGLWESGGLGVREMLDSWFI
jgi:hypothetical protein